MKPGFLCEKIIPYTNRFNLQYVIKYIKSMRETYFIVRLEGMHYKLKEKDRAHASKY